MLKPLEVQVEVPQKTVKHSPGQKLTDALIGMLAGCEALYELNVRVRPDLPLQEAFGRVQGGGGDKEGGCADRSTISDTFDAFNEETVAQLRGAVETIHRLHSPIFSHDFEHEMLVLEVDLTGLTASAESEGSKKGYFPNKPNKRGRQLVRVIAPQYGEVIFDKLYWGNTNSSEVLKETIREVERILADLAEESQKRKRTLIRVDGGFGTDKNLNWLCWRGYQFIAKGYSGKRAKKVAKSVPEEEWREGPTAGQLLGRPTQPHRYGRRTKSVVRQWRDEKGKVHQDLLITTSLSELEEQGPEEVAKLYDQRGAMEVDIKGDKRGLGIEKRKKKRFDAQEALVLLAQLAHNLARWLKEWFLAGSEAGGLGMERLVREVFAMPGRVVVARQEVGWWRSSSSSKVQIKLPTLHPWAKAVADGINEYFKRNGLRAIWDEI